jgi:DNA end-binding protein Ku
VWSGTVTFGLVAIPVQMLSAVSSHKVSFRQIHVADRGRVRYRKICELDEQVLGQDDIGRAYESGAQLVPISDAELDHMPLPTAKAIEISGFLPVDAVPPEMIGTPYLLSAASAAASKPYVLMRRALERSGKAGVGKMAVRESERLVLIRPYGDALAVHTLHWPDEIRSAADAAPKGKVEISDEEAARADALIEALGEVDMSAYRDDYADALQELLTAKAEGTELPAAPEQPERVPESVDLMTALEAAVADARKGGADVHHLADRKTTSKKASKAAGKKTAAKKTAAKKAPAKRSGTRGSKRAG